MGRRDGGRCPPCRNGGKRRPAGWGLTGACLLLLSMPPAFAHSGEIERTRRALETAKQQAARHHAESEAAKQQAASDEARAAALAQREVAAAAALRHLEDQTAQAAATLDDLTARGEAARQALKRNEAALATLLPVMQRLSRQPAATMLAVPASPEDAVRGVLVLQGIAAEIELRAKAVHDEAAKVAALEASTRTQQASLAVAAAVQKKAEDALNAQIDAARAAETAELDTAAQAAAAEAAANQNAHDLQDMIDRLQANAKATAARIPAGPAAPAGAPVAGTLVQAYGASTVAGPAVGLVYRAAPGAHVVSPCGGPVLYAAPFQNYGLLVILDCGHDYDFVLSGMQHLDVTAGQQVARGQPVGQMKGYDASTPGRQPELYVELRHHGKPVDPAGWLSGGGSG